MFSSHLCIVLRQATACYCAAITYVLLGSWFPPVSTSVRHELSLEILMRLMPMSRKPTLIFIVLGVVLVLLLAFPAFRTAPPPHLFQHLASWQFTTSNAATSTFTQAQCNTAFPRLYQPINEAVATRANHHVQLPELDIPAGRCMFRALIYEKEVGCSACRAWEDPQTNICVM